MFVCFFPRRCWPLVPRRAGEDGSNPRPAPLLPGAPGSDLAVWPGAEMGTTCLNMPRSPNLCEPSQKGFFPSRSGKGVRGLRAGMSAQPAASTARARLAFFLFPSVFPFLEENFSVSESKRSIPTFAVVVLFYLSPFSCFQLKSDRFGGALGCFPLEAGSSPGCRPDAPQPRAQIGPGEPRGRA